MKLGVHVGLVLSVAIVSAVAVGALFWWLLGRPPLRQAGSWTAANSFDFAKIVLALIGGAGAVVALVISYRKQHLGEAAEKREDIKLFAERFTKASDQLGSDKAPVRLAGMYALEDLAQGTPDQRQTIVNVLCAYLRMPYVPPTRDDSTSDESAMPDAPAGTGEGAIAGASERADREENERRHQERQVRLTAQRILAAHLRRTDAQSRSVDTFWAEIDLDLTGATLLELDLRGCHVQTASFARVKFSGNANFDEAKFSGNAGFAEADFSRYAGFTEAKFGGFARFTGAKFGGFARFHGAEFSMNAAFDGAEFSGYAGFEHAKFSRYASFAGAELSGHAGFDKARVRIDGSWIRVWPPGLGVVDPPTDVEARLPDRDGRWGYLRPIGEEAKPIEP